MSVLATVEVKAGTAAEHDLDMHEPMPEGWIDTPLLRWVASLIERDFYQTEAGRAAGGPPHDVLQRRCDRLLRRMKRAEMVQRFRGRR